MMTPEQLDNWFTYHPPTEETAPKYAAIRAAEEAVHALFYRIRSRDLPDAMPLSPAVCDLVNAATRTFAEVIDANAPDSADKSAAIRCVRLARNGANETIMVSLRGPFMGDPLDMAREEIIKARWQANSAIACNGK